MTNQPLPITKSAGRPRSASVDRAIIRTATRMFYKLPYQDVTMEAISREAGISKATLYRRWPQKSTLAIEVLIHLVMLEKIEFTGRSYRDHLINNLKALRNMLASDYSDVIVSVIAETQHDKELRRIFIEQFLKPVQAIGDADLEKAIANGEVRPVVDKDLLFDQMFGFFYYRLLVAHKSISDEEIAFIVDSFLTVAGNIH